jgi:hypothetical protein
MKSPKALLAVTAVELLAAQKLLKEKKKALKKAKTKLEKDNAQRALKLIQKTVADIEKQREVLEAQV